LNIENAICLAQLLKEFYN